MAWRLAEEATDLRSWTLLSAVLADRLDREQSAAVTAALSNPDAFAAIVAAADRERVLPALHLALSGRFDKAAKFWRAVVAKAYRDNRQRNAEIRGALVELGEAAAAANLRLAALKGAAWILEDETDYAAWRWMIDFDVLVDAEEFDRMPALLGRLGYEPASESKRYRNNFHHAPYWRPNIPITIEVHRHLGWRHRLLAPEIVFGSARPVAPGLLLPAPWCRAFHAIIHWQIQDLGLSRSTVRLKDVVEIARFLARGDVDWDRVAAHARAVGSFEACEAAVALAAELLGAPVPRALTPGRTARRHVARALAVLASPLRTWLTTEMWRAGTLWRCEKIAYRLAIRGATRRRIWVTVWTARIARLPILAVRAIGILARAILRCAHRRQSTAASLPVPIEANARYRSDPNAATLPAPADSIKGSQSDHGIVPRQIRVEASSFCQLRCPSCPTTTGAIRPAIGSGFLRLDDFRRLIADNPSIARVELSNYGEILLNPDLLGILKYACDKSVAVTMSNGLNLNHATDALLEGLVRYRVRHITCSIDGASAATYRVYRVRGRFEKVIHHIERINHFKRMQRSEFPHLTWQFVVFGHNEHEIPLARKMAARLGMSFQPKISWDAKFSPVRNKDFVREQTGEPAVTREEYEQRHGEKYLRSICHQLWDDPQINWDGKNLGCCRNFWGDFGGNAFKDGLAACVNHEKMIYARDMLRGRKPPRDDIPCSTCELYHAMQARSDWIVRQEG